MIDEKTFETLSRYVDGDLGPDEAAAIEQELAGDDELGRALADIRQLREDLRTLALDERPPEALDHMVRPLRRAGRPMRQRRALAFLVAAAAVLVVALIVVEEVGRSRLRSDSPASGGAGREVFVLKNLPAADEDAPIGAIESLLAGDDPEPVLVDPEPLEVMGPLDRPPGIDDSGLALKIGTILVPVPVIVGAEGLMMTLGVEEGRVTLCRPSAGIESTLVAGDVCRQILSVGGIGLDDGQYEAVVVRWDVESSPGPGQEDN